VQWAPHVRACTQACCAGVSSTDWPDASRTRANSSMMTPTSMLSTKKPPTTRNAMKKRMAAGLWKASGWDSGSVPSTA
jgi:hypothetical protein